MTKGPSKSKRNLATPTPRRRKYDEEFKQQAVAMVRNGQSMRSVAQGLGISENLPLPSAKMKSNQFVTEGDSHAAILFIW
jgi:hypothetical protein